jgi:4-hydroxy-tetrahydrodipicolinate synthase
VISPSGTFYVVPTAFDDRGAFDPDAQAALIEAAIAWGVDGFTVMGVMSEADSLTDDERERALDVIFEAARGRAPIVVGCSAASATRVAARAGDAAARGAVAALVSAPPLVRNADALPRFFERVADGADLPIVIQDEPAATGTFMSVTVLLRCINSCGATTVKLEDPPTPPKITRLLTERPELNVFGGLGGVSALTELARGACGTMTGFSFPEVLRAVRLAVEDHDMNRAGAIFDRFLPVITFEGQPVVGLAIRKEILRRRGALATNRTRELAELDDITARELDLLFERLGFEPMRGRLEIDSVHREPSPSRTIAGAAERKP